MFKRFLPVLFAFALVLVVAPTRAAELIDADDLPVQGPVASERSSEIFMVNGQPLGVSRWEIIYGDWEVAEDDRLHFVWHDLDAAGAIITTFEFILADGMIYERRNTDQRWRAGPLGEEGSPTPREVEVFYSLPPGEFPDDFILVYVGEAEVNGAQAGHYQFRVREERLTEEMTFVTEDAFHQRAPTNGIENYYSKRDIVLGLRNATGGEDLLEYVAVWSEPNTPIAITPPPADEVNIVEAQTLADAFQASPALALWMWGNAVRAQLGLVGQ